MRRNVHVPNFQVLVLLFGNSPLFGTVAFKLCFMVYFFNFAKSFSEFFFLAGFLKVKVVFVSKSNDA